MVLLVFTGFQIHGELVEFDNGLEAIVLNLEEDNVGVV
jgi:F-type H+-transporting ATPase subunit alpha